MSTEIGFVPAKRNGVVSVLFAVHGWVDAIIYNTASAFMAVEFEELVNRNFI